MQEKMIDDYSFCSNCIASCVTEDHLKSVYELIRLFKVKYTILTRKEDVLLFKMLEDKLNDSILDKRDFIVKYKRTAA